MKKKYMLLVIIILSVVLSILTVNLFFMLSPQFGKRPNGKRITLLAKSALYDGSRFRNQLSLPVIEPKSVGKILKLQFKKHSGRVPKMLLPSVKPEFQQNEENNDISVVWFGHSSFLMHINETWILTDPVFSKRPSPVSFAGPKSFPLANPVLPADLPLPDIILISHDHFDHLDYKSIKQYYRSVKTYLVPLGVRDHLERWGVPSSSIIEFDWGDSIKTGKGLHFIAAPAQHFSGRRRQDNSTLWCSWIIMNGEKKIFFSGDSGYGSHFKMIGDTYGPFDIAFMECGAYGQYWPYIHMLPEQSLQAFIDLNGKVLIPIHWAKYNLSFHPWKEPIERLSALAVSRNINLLTPLIGQRISPGDSSFTTDRWWESIE
jgi:L-ascorbate metabolism protein UlaG (beta-lactamase superfamily)